MSSFTFCTQNCSGKNSKDLKKHFKSCGKAWKSTATLRTSLSHFRNCFASLANLNKLSLY